MQVPLSNSRVLRSFIAGAVLLFGASACSRPDRAETGTSGAAATTEDTAVSRATQDVPGTGQDRVAADTTTAIGETGTGAAPGDTAPAKIQRDAPRAATASPSRERGNRSTPADSGAAGNRAIERDTAAKPESDSARVTEDTSETSLNQADTAAAAGYAEMARDTTSGADQVDTTGAAIVAGAGDTTMSTGRVRPIEESTETMGQITGDTNVTAGIADSVNAAIGARGDDTTGNAGRVRPPEDSTELQGNASAAPTETPGDTTSQAAVGAEVGDTAMNAGRVRPVEDSTETANLSAAESASVNAADTADEAPVAETPESEVAGEPADTQPVAAAAVSGTVTGADAVAMVSRQGGQCGVVDPETDEEVRWDMSSTPATLNPCGLGSMNLSKVLIKQ